MNKPRFKFHRVELKYKNYKVIGIQKLVKTYYDEYKPYTFVDKEGYVCIAYDLKVYKNNKLINKSRIVGYGDIFLINKEELMEATGISSVAIVPGGF